MGILKVPDSGTGPVCTEAHKILMPAKNSPSGHPNRYGPVTYPFHDAVSFSSTSIIGGSLAMLSSAAASGLGTGGKCLSSVFKLEDKVT